MDPSDFPSDLEFFVKCPGPVESAAVQRYLFGKFHVEWAERPENYLQSVDSEFTNLLLRRVDNGIDPPDLYIESTTDGRRVDSNSPDVEAEDLLLKGLETVVEELTTDEPMWDGPFGGYHASIDESGDMQVWSSKDMNTKEFHVAAENLVAASEASLKACGYRPPVTEEQVNAAIRKVNSVLGVGRNIPRIEPNEENLKDALRNTRRQLKKMKERAPSEAPEKKDGFGFIPPE